MAGDATDSHRILACDRAMPGRASLVELLKGLGHTVLAAPDLIDAKLIGYQTEVDLVVLAEDDCAGAAVKLVAGMRRSPWQFLTPALVVFGSPEVATAFRHQDRQLRFQALTRPVEGPELAEALERIFRPIPDVGQVVSMQHGEGDPLAARTRSVRGVRAEFELLASHRVEGATVQVAFPSLGLGRATWIGEVVRSEPGLAVVELREYLGREDQRRYFRRAVQLTARYRLPGDFARLATTADVSMAGVRLSGVVDQDLSPGTVIDLSLVGSDGRRLDTVDTQLRAVTRGPEGPQWSLAFGMLGSAQEETLLHLIWDGEAPKPDPAN